MGGEPRLHPSFTAWLRCRPEEALHDLMVWAVASKLHSLATLQVPQYGDGHGPVRPVASKLHSLATLQAGHGNVVVDQPLVASKLHSLATLQAHGG